jgi:outer membrane receptor protein involved in Fe transport
MMNGHYRYHSTLAAARTVQARLSYQRIDDDRRLRDRGATVETRERNRAHTFGLGIDAVAALGVHNVLSYGVELSHDRVGSSRLDHDGLSGNEEVAVSRYPDGAAMSSLGLYAQDEWAVHPRLRLVPGVRLSGFDLDIPAADREVPARLRLAALSGGLGALVALVSGINLAANAGRGFRAPNVFDLSSLGNRPGNRYQIPNPDLKPESILGVDAGVKLAFAGLSGELFGFYSSYRDRIEAAPTGDLDPAGRQLVRSINVSRVDLVGAEAALGARLPGRLALSTNLSYTHGRDRLADGRSVPADRIPPLNLRVGLLWRPDERLFAEGFVRAAGRQDRLSERDLTDARINPAGTPGWSTLNLRLGGQLLRHLRALASLENLLDTGYREHGSGMYASGFSATLTLEVER